MVIYITHPCVLALCEISQGISLTLKFKVQCLQGDLSAKEYKTERPFS